MLCSALENAWAKAGIACTEMHVIGNSRGCRNSSSQVTSKKAERVNFVASDVTSFVASDCKTQYTGKSKSATQFI